MNCRVALIGTSLAIDSIDAALRAIPGLELLRFEFLPAKHFTQLTTLAPDVVIFDMAVQQPEGLFPELMAQPGLLVLGFDIETQQMLLLSGEPVRLATVEDLVAVLSARGVRLEAGRSPVASSPDTWQRR